MADKSYVGEKDKGIIVGQIIASVNYCFTRFPKSTSGFLIFLVVFIFAFVVHGRYLDSKAIDIAENSAKVDKCLRLLEAKQEMPVGCWDLLFEEAR